MIRRTLLTRVAVVFLAVVSGKAAEPAAAVPRVALAFEFDRAGDAEGWRANAELADVKVADGVLHARATGNDPIFEFQRRLDLRASAWQRVEVRIKADRDGLGELFWANTDQGKYGGFSQDKTLRFPIRGDGRWQVCRLRPFWQAEGRVVRLRLDVYDGASFDIDSIRVVEEEVPEWTGAPVFEFPAAGGAWVGIEGAVVKSGDTGLEVESPTVEARVAGPRLAVDAAVRSTVSVRMRVDRGRRGTLYFATERGSGLHSVTFPLRADGGEHTYNVDMQAAQAWQGRVVALALRCSDETPSRATLRWLRLAEGPDGPAELEPVQVTVHDLRPRVGRPFTVSARVGNAGGITATNLQATLVLPAGVRQVGEGKRPGRSTLASGETAEWQWSVQAEAPGDAVVGVKLGADAGVSAERRVPVAVTPGLSAAARLAAAVPKPVRGPIEVGAYYFPGWPNAGPWEPIRGFPERRPGLGWYREGDPEVADWHIRWAVEHGITFFAYDWYWSRGDRQLEHALHDGFFRASHRGLMKFCLLWANHNAPGTSSLEDCRAVTRYWIEHYFHRPEHLRIDGRPVMILFSPDRMTADLGPQGVKPALAAMRAECEKAGVAPVYVVACVPDAGVARQCAAEGYDAVTAYNWPHLGVPAGELYAPFAGLLEGYRRQWGAVADLAGIPLLPPICGGWDSRPWHGENQLVRYERTPALFAAHLRDARDFVETRARDGEGAVRRVVLIEAWNEWGEGSYIEPHAEYGFGYLDAVREVFTEAPREHVDLVPADLGQGPYEVPVPPNDRAKWEFEAGDEGWSQVMDLGQVHVEGGVRAGVSTGNDPALFGPSVRLKAAGYRDLRIRLRLSPVEGGPFSDRAQVFWRTATLPESEANSVRFGVEVDGQWHDYRVAVAGHPRWRGIVTRLRLDPVNRRGVRVELDRVELDGGE